MNQFFVLLILLVLMVLAYTSLYNGLVTARQKVGEAWSGIDVQLKRRYDLIPNLVKTVQGYATHEREVFEKVTQARSSAIQVPEGHIAEQAQAENVLSGTLKSIFALAENYPELKANANFLKLQEDLTEAEDQISASRRIYNGNVTNLNVKVESFPSNFVAGMHNFKKEEFFELSAEEKQQAEKAPEINF